LSALEAFSPRSILLSGSFSVIALTADWTPRRPVVVELDLPQEVAEEIERLQRHDPDLLGRMLGYAVLRAACYEGVRDRSGTPRFQKNT